MKKLINFLKRDYASVRNALTQKHNLPHVITLVYYVALAPIGCLLYPLTKVWWYFKVTRKLDKLMKETDY